MSLPHASPACTGSMRPDTPAAAIPSQLLISKLCGCSRVGWIAKISSMLQSRKAHATHQCALAHDRCSSKTARRSLSTRQPEAKRPLGASACFRATLAWKHQCVHTRDNLKQSLFVQRWESNVSNAIDEHPYDTRPGCRTCRHVPRLAVRGNSLLSSQQSQQ